LYLPVPRAGEPEWFATFEPEVDRHLVLVDRFPLVEAVSRDDAPAEAEQIDRRLATGADVIMLLRKEWHIN
jgi:hypothetical protein